MVMVEEKKEARETTRPRVFFFFTARIDDLEPTVAATRLIFQLGRKENSARSN